MEMILNLADNIGLLALLTLLMIGALSVMLVIAIFAWEVVSVIKKYRKNRGLTIAQFSEMISKSSATVSKYENGTIAIDIDTLLDISDALEIDLINLIDYKSPHVKQEKLPSKATVVVDLHSDGDI